nr:RecName: Full=Herinase [Hericium erinaceus]
VPSSFRTTITDAQLRG